MPEISTKKKMTDALPAQTHYTSHIITHYSSENLQLWEPAENQRRYVVEYNARSRVNNTNNRGAGGWLGVHRVFHKQN